MAQGHKTGGRIAGIPNKRSLPIETFAKSIVESIAYQEKLRARAEDGLLAPGLETMLFYYAYGKPVERVEHSGNAQHPVVLLYGSHDKNALI